MDDSYTQCELQRDNARQVAWIPSRFALVGESLRIRSDGDWIAGWRVLSVHATCSRGDLDAYRSAQKRFSDVLSGH